jgi:REP element-mobilizing transposase RayT
MIHERKPNRLKGYDYSRDNLYFVTSCVHNHICCFGEIVVAMDRSVGTGRDLSLLRNDLSPQRDLTLRRGPMATTKSDSSEQQMILNEFGKIAEKQWYWLGEQYPYVVLHEFRVMPNHIHGIIEIDRTRIPVRDLSVQESETIKIKSLSELMGAYKTTVSKQIHLLNFTKFKWQRSFHDNIIRDEESFNRISNYIINNPQNWKHDKFYNLYE